MGQDRPQQFVHFDQAKLILDSNATEGEISKAFDGVTPDGIFQLFVEYGMTPVILQQRLPTPKKVVGSWTAPGEWKTIQIIPVDAELEAHADTLPLCSNFEYQFITETAGARVTLGVQWEGVN